MPTNQLSSQRVRGLAKTRIAIAVKVMKAASPIKTPVNVSWLMDELGTKRQPESQGISSRRQRNSQRKNMLKPVSLGSGKAPLHLTQGHIL